MIHKKILQAGANNPDASLEELADEVSGASPELVEKVFEEYGDPASADEREESASAASDSDSSAASDPGSSAAPDPDAESDDTPEPGAGGERDADATDSPDERGPGPEAADSTTPAQRATLAESTASGGTGSTVSTASSDAYPVDGSEATASDGATGSSGSPNAGARVGRGTDSSKSNGLGTASTATADTESVGVGAMGQTSDGTTTDQAPTVPGAGGESAGSAETDPPLDPAELSDRQRETLRAIAAHPDATQAELAEELDVSAATISNRVASIPGIEWETRREFVDTMFDNGTSSTDDAESTDHTSPTGALAEQVDALERQVAELDRRVDESGGSGALSDPELAHKVVHACLSSERISEDEELRILEAMLD